MTAPYRKSYTLQACDTDLTIDSVTVRGDPDFFASNATGATITLTNTETTDGMGHQVCVKNDTANDLSAINITFVGFYGIYPITETIAMPEASVSVKSTKFFTKLTSATLSSTIGASTVDIGVAEVCRTPIIAHNWRGANAGINTSFDDETAIDYTLRFTRSKIEPSVFTHITSIYTGLYDSWRWFNFGDPDVVNATTDTITNDQEPGTALAYLINSYTKSSTPTMYIEITQQSIG